jgi:hypothetical protein
MFESHLFLFYWINAEMFVWTFFFSFPDYQDDDYSCYNLLHLLATFTYYHNSWRRQHHILQSTRNEYNVDGVTLASHVKLYIFGWMLNIDSVFSCLTCGLLKSCEEKIELQRMRRSHNNTTSVGFTFSHPYHRASATFDTEYSFVDGKHVP